LTAPLVLTGEQKGKICSDIEMAIGCLKMDAPIAAGIHLEQALELLTSPRTEALGLSKESWSWHASDISTKYENNPNHVYLKTFSEALTAIASSLVDAEEKG
jgi:hypothetical protein